MGNGNAEDRWLTSRCFPVRLSVDNNTADVADDPNSANLEEVELFDFNVDTNVVEWGAFSADFVSLSRLNNIPDRN